MNWKFAFICPWFGPHIPGGAERAARELVLNLARREHDVRVLTTCARDFYHWEPYHTAGVATFEGIPVFRFSINDRDAAAFDQVNKQLLEGHPLSAWEETVFLKNIISSDALCQHIWRLRHDCLFIFTPYMFGTSYWGAKLVPEKSFLFPCLHDEPYLYLPRYQRLLKNVRSLLFYSSGEGELAREVLHRTDCHRVVGLGINNKDTPSQENIAHFKESYNISSPYLFLPGRKQAEKNTALAVDLFSRYKTHHEDPVKLVLSGPGTVEIKPEVHDDVIDLGYLSEQHLSCAYQAARAVCLPSVRESFSFTMFEAWLHKKPVVGHAACRATKLPLELSQAGITFSDFNSFCAGMEMLRNMSDEQLAEVGTRGYNYVTCHHTWDAVIKKFLTYIDEAMS
ncbi:glycosyltransferase family 4 protein [candidate division CSSED10-310 bacterium]|uniref:Glycosyltransferase family 4 protein n=1 Tax=candidate division CSSED10-310 bacterium TaxID=2855610 RepID=A0ABV6YVT5_UNCC1